MDTARHIIKIGGKTIGLSVKEFELLELLLKKKGKLLTRNFITESIWGFEYFGTSRTIDTTIAHLRKKLGLIGEKIVAIKGIGYKFIGEDE